MSQAQDIARTILQQLGGAEFCALTGCHTPIATGNGLRFFIPKTRGINRVTITLTPADDYFVQFECIKGTFYAVVSDAEGVYCDMLQDVFEHHTGLYVTLKPRRA